MSLSDRELLLKARQAYYFGTPIMTDAQYDALEERLRAQNPDDPILKMVGAPVPKDSLLKRARHRIHMGSQEKVTSFGELVKWHRNREPAATHFHVSYKADGSSISLYYEGGRLVQAVTRGDGFEGEDISATAALFQGVPLILPEELSVGIRCEAVLTIEDWRKVDPEMRTNPRNVASGILGRLDGKGARHITALAFDVTALESDEGLVFPEPKTETQKMELLLRLGFHLPVWRRCEGLEEVQDFFEETRQKRERDEMPYWIDGVVVKYDDLQVQRELGVVDNRPKGQVAWKFEAQTKESVIERVEWQVGNTGAVTPVAHVQPVRIGGTTVTRASLANPENIRALGATIGARVLVAKAGDIIPAIIEVLERKEETPIEPPTHCPVCESRLETRKNVDGSNSAVLFCLNPDCPARTLGALKRFCKSRDILGLGDSVLTALVEEELALRVPDLYLLTPGEIENLIINEEKGVRLGRKRAEAICREIAEKGKRMNLAEFLGAFGIRGLGVRRAEMMMEANPELQDLERWFDGSLLNEEFAARAGVPNLGTILHDALKEKERTIRDTLVHIELLPWKGSVQVQRAAGGKVFCITGSLPSGKKKKDYAAPLAAMGHALVDEVGPGVDYLVVSDPNAPESAKTKKAKKLGIPLITEEELQKFLGAPGGQLRLPI